MLLEKRVMLFVSGEWGINGGAFRGRTESVIRF